MFQNFTQKQHNSAMEIRDHQKNGASLKSRMSKKNFQTTIVMKSFMSILVLCCFTAFPVSAQDCSELKNDPEMRQELQSLANTAGSDLMKCCSKWGGNNLKATIIWDKDEDGLCQTRISKLTKVITITMTVSWTGSISGASYWIKGRLLFNMENSSRKWEKISDSGGFQSGCGNDCIH